MVTVFREGFLTKVGKVRGRGPKFGPRPGDALYPIRAGLLDAVEHLVYALAG